MTRSKIKVSFGISLGLFITAASALACGLDWRLPTNHFDGVNEQGYVAYWEKIGDLELGDDLKLPLVIGFRSNKETSAPSPYLGSGWIMPLMESNMVQTGEDSFVMMQPDGWNNLFLRKDDTTLNGSAGWMAEINGNTITAWAKCGWKMEFFKGHIISMTTPKNRKFDFIYSGGLVTAIRENGVDKLTVVQESTGEVKALLFNEKRMEIALDQKPRVQNIAGQKVVGEMDRSLKSINPNDGTSKMFEFAVNDKIQPTLKITSKANSERLFTWDPATKRILSDNNWRYKIESSPGLIGNAAIGRANDKKQSEYWFYDASKGEETVQTLDGTKTVKTWFKSGLLSGKIRKIEQTKDSKTVIIGQWAYDENGSLLRKTHENGDVETFSRDKDGKTVSMWKPVPTQEQINQKAKEFTQILAAEINEGKKQDILYKFALYCINISDSNKARELAPMILNPQKKFNVVLQSYDHDIKLTPTEKILAYNKLLQEYPNQAKALNELIEIRKQEL